ncbi:hypothetical protein [Endozoicomonas sp.]|uniref:hypothetical protein n=1 Tax=Endozoicomonas sp. TaxID=1892382 RepID=UPI00383B31F5
MKQANFPPPYSPSTGLNGSAYGTTTGVVASAPGVSVLTDAERMTRLQGLAQRYELSGGAVCKLRQLEDYDIVIVADDSSSMTSLAHEVPKDNPYAMVPTRWQELCSRVADIVEFATALDKDGIDIYFLNGGKHLNITQPEEARRLFEKTPNGYTPLKKTYQQVISDKLRSPDDKVLILVATDGEPNVLKGNRWCKDTQGFIDCLTKREDPARCPTSIMACTDNKEEIGWLNKLDDSAPYLDVLDDYESEKNEVLTAQKNKISFSKGDYIVKTLLGPIDELYDNLDEKRLTRKQLAEYRGEEPPPERRFRLNKCTVL